MDINELNQMSVTALFSKLISQPNVAADSSGGFASLLVQNDAASDLKPSSAVEARPVRKTAKAAGEKDRPVQDEGVKKDAPKSSAAEGRSENKKVSKKDSARDVLPEEAVPAGQETVPVENKEASADVADAAVVAANPAVPAAEPLAPAAEADGFNAFETVAAVDGVMADGAVLEGDGTAGGEAVVLPAGSLKIVAVDGKQPGDFVLTPENLAAHEEVSFVNPLTGKTETLGGAELAQKIFGTGSMNVVSEPTENPLSRTEVASGAKTVPASDGAVLPVAEADLPFASQVKDTSKNAAENADMQPVENENLSLALKNAPVAAPSVKNSDAAVAVADDETVLLADEADVQAMQLEEISGEKLLNVEVTVEEEKISYRNARDMVKDRVAVEQAVAAADSAEASDALLAPAAASKMPSPAVNASAASVAQPVPAAVVQMAAADDAAPVQVAVSEASGVSSASGHAASLVGSEVVHAAKAEAGSKNAETSFKDVYKGMSREAVEQVKVNITKSAVKGVDTIEVRLKPEDLGHIEIKMQIKEGRLHAHIISSRPETMEALQKDAQILEKAFNDAGFQTDDSSLSFSYRGDSQSDRRQDANAELRNFIGEVFETEANAETLSAEAANQNWVTENGVNIRV